MTNASQVSNPVEPRLPLVKSCSRLICFTLGFACHSGIAESYLLDQLGEIRSEPRLQCVASALVLDVPFLGQGGH